ncbi:Ubiquinone/menaquinone biosynthesis C-methylase UbiE [Acetitomaculum ruminis DSM 5522]|uniref:Ubiquinone/menaquinone biosynthesis C-methylase UbiE n=2 Tax=Acetitomaculum ruminis TaxID=2382 RepID=A0A1I0ZL15_9FIRM|nr:Ubiquinone/menaquinone biosynthesis C-methylase UbiE [Acetitomaculum ruminis DSM 5522]
MDFEKSIQTISKHWDDASVTFDKEHATEDLGLWKEYLEKVIGLNGNGKVLDVGTGTGFLAFMLNELGYGAVGIDISEKMMEIGRAKALERNQPVSFINSPCEKTPFDDGEFDAVVNCRLMWTLTKPDEAVNEWKRILKSGGKVISFMRMMSASGGQGHSVYENNIELPLIDGSRDKYVEVYKKAGLKNIQTWELPEEMSVSDMPSWTVFVGEK